jgi:cytochrome b pre-mRNA-processing protein 3
MIFGFLRRNPSADTIQALYGAIVAQARSPGFYSEWRVPDTVDGRFELIVLHLALVTRRLEREHRGKSLAQALFERFCEDLDGNLREMGIGDLSVPRRMHDFASAYYGRSRAYGEALASGDRVACARALARNVFGEPAPGDSALRLADYMIAVARGLDQMPLTELNGALRFPDLHEVVTAPH